MASYWIVVPRGNPELYELLSVAFRGRAGFSVIVDRRGTAPDGVDAAAQADPDSERRAAAAALANDEFIIAEQAERAAEEREHRHTGPRIPVRRRRARRSGYRIENSPRQPRAAAGPSSGYDRLFTL